MKPVIEEKSVLLYDGLCGFCDRLVSFLLQGDRQQVFHFAPLGGVFASEFLNRHPHLKAVDSLVLVENSGLEDEVVWVRSEAVRRITRQLGGMWRIVDLLLSVVPKSLQDLGYDIFARNRYRWFGRYDACRVPDSSILDRFLE
ncbi:MAG: DCC1-like thiol-disulfide oxidoreductase family protein [Longimicrobiales bacterium]|nr:DCC1-like thiol-disulfide oxidoreductase family protein [Longimicrobiales bacterium]